jgi:hypothetical protein
VSLLHVPMLLFMRIRIIVLTENYKQIVAGADAVVSP